MPYDTNYYIFAWSVVRERYGSKMVLKPLLTLCECECPHPPSPLKVPEYRAGWFPSHFTFDLLLYPCFHCVTLVVLRPKEWEGSL